MAPIVGTQLGPYHIEAAVGAGGMGEVYRARDTRLGRTVAIKILPQGEYATDESRQRFQREAQVLSSLLILISARFTTLAKNTVRHSSRWSTWKVRLSPHA